LPVDGPSDYEIGYGKPPTATRFKKGNKANPHGRPRGSTSLAAMLQRALDAPAAKPDGKRRRSTKRELMIRGLVERSAGADLAATKLLFELLRKADPRAVAADPAEAAPLGEDALTLLKERLGRLVRAHLTDQLGAAANGTDPPLEPTGSSDPGGEPEPGDS
jgi:Family of unknown function (DUF5681)